MVHVEAPTGSTLYYTDDKMQKLENLVLTMPEAKSIFSTLGWVPEKR